MLSEIPIEVFAYDLLELEDHDLREKPISARRALLEELLLNENPQNISLSNSLDFEKWEELDSLRENSRAVNSEGLMLKQSAKKIEDYKKNK